MRLGFLVLAAGFVLTANADDAKLKLAQAELTANRAKLDIAARIADAIEQESAKQERARAEAPE